MKYKEWFYCTSFCAILLLGEVLQPAHAGDDNIKAPNREMVLRRLIELHDVPLSVHRTCAQEKLKFEEPDPHGRRLSTYKTIGDLTALLLADVEGYLVDFEISSDLQKNKKEPVWRVGFYMSATSAKGENGETLVGGFSFNLSGVNYRYVSGSMFCHQIN